MKLIKSAAIYKCIMPTASELAVHVMERPFEEIDPSAFAGAGFVPPLANGPYIEPFEGGYAFAVRYDEKIIPATVTTAEANKQIAELEDKNQRKLSRAERNEIREQTFTTLKLKALTRTRLVTCFYVPKSELLIVPTSSSSLADTVTKLLVSVMGSVKATTIYVSDAKNGLTTRLSAYIDGDVSAFDEFSVGTRCKLTSMEGRKYSFDQPENLYSATEGLREAIHGNDAKVTEIELVGDALQFRLTDKFKIKSVVFKDAPPPDDEAEMDAVGRFKHEAAVQTALFAEAVNNLCKLLDYKPPTENTTYQV